MENIPISEYVDQARSLLEEINREARSKQILSDWQKASETNTAGAYNSFIEKYPDNKFARLAKVKLKILEKNSTKTTSDNQQPAKDEVDREWEDILAKNAPPLFAKFIADNPDSKYLDSAKSRLKQLQDDYWVETQNGNTRKA